MINPDMECAVMKAYLVYDREAALASAPVGLGILHLKVTTSDLGLAFPFANGWTTISSLRPSCLATELLLVIPPQRAKP